MAKEPRIILYDIETSHNLAAAFRLFEEVTNFENIIQERYIVCASWKVLGEKKVHHVSVLDDPKRFKKNPNDDKFVVEKLNEVLSEADVIVAHNGDAFDIRFIDTRSLYHGLSPLPVIPSVDTLKIAKSRFMFNSNKLDYLGQFLKVGRKIKTDNSLWLGVLRGDRKSIKKMQDYNDQDVLLLEKIFLKLRPYAANYINRQLFVNESGCPRCGSNHVQSRGTHKAVSRVYQRFQCQDCGGWFKSGKPIIKEIKTRTL